MNCWDFQLLNLSISVSASISIDYGTEVYQISGSQTSSPVTSRQNLGKRVAACGSPKDPTASNSPIMAKRGTCGLDRYIISTNVYSVAGQMYGGLQGDDPQQVISATTGERIELPWISDPYRNFGYKAPVILFNESERAKSVYKKQHGCDPLPPDPQPCQFGFTFSNIYYPEGSYAFAVFENPFLLVGTNTAIGIYSSSGAATASGSCTVTIACNQM